MGMQGAAVQQQANDEATMERATPVQMRDSLQMANALKMSGLRFVPIPVLDDADFSKLSTMLLQRLEEIEKTLP